MDGIDGAGMGSGPGIVLTPLTARELEDLATYNSEAARGLQHTSQWEEKMGMLQKRFEANVPVHPYARKPG